MSIAGPDPASGDRDVGDVVDLDGMVLPDASTGEPVDLGSGPRLGLLVLIRHRY